MTDHSPRQGLRTVSFLTMLSISVPFRFHIGDTERITTQLASEDNAASPRKAGYIRPTRAGAIAIAGRRTKILPQPCPTYVDPSWPAKPASAPEEAPWSGIFVTLKSLPPEHRTSSAYILAFQDLIALERPHTCLSLIRHMAEADIPRPLWLYAEASAEAVRLREWKTVVNSFQILTKREQFDPTCPSIRSVCLSALQACEKLGKGSRAIRVYEMCRQLRPPLAILEGSLRVMHACDQAGTASLGVPSARTVLEELQKVYFSSAGKSPGAEAGFVVDAEVSTAIRVLAQGNCSIEARKQLDDWSSLVSADTAGAVVRGLARDGYARQALQLYINRFPEQARTYKDAELAMAVVYACCRDSQLTKAWHVYEDMPSKYRTPSRSQILWISASRAGREDVLEWLLKDAIASEGRIGEACLHASLCNLARQGMQQWAERLVELVREKGQVLTPMAYFALIAACEKVNEWRRLLHWYTEMVAADIEPDPARYGMALQACERLGEWQEGLAIVKCMQAEGHIVSASYWKRLYLLLGRERRGEEAVALLQEIKAHGGDPEVICYEAAITAIARSKGKVAARTCLESYEEQGVSLGRGAYTSVIGAHRESGDWQGAWEVYLRMRRKCSESPSAMTRAALVSVFVSAGKAGREEVKQVCEEQTQSGESWPEWLTGGIVQILVEWERYESATEMFDEWWPRAQQEVSWNVYNAIMRACGKTGQWELACRVLRRMNEQGMKADVVIHGCLLSAYAVAGEWKQAYAVLKATEEKGDIVLNAVCYTSVITALASAQEWRIAFSLLLKMLKTGPTPDVQAYNAVMSACANAGEAVFALQIFQAMRRQGILPNDVTYAIAILACWKANDWRRAVELLQHMKGAGHTPNIITLTLVIDVCDRNGKFDVAAYVFENSVVGFIRSENYEVTSTGPAMVVDLHGYTKPVARAALRAGLKRITQMYMMSGRNRDIIKDMVFIPGQGKHSDIPFEPVLGPAMQEMLEHDFRPPLQVQTVHGNAGRMVVKADDLVQWLDSQTCQRQQSPAELKGGLLKLRSSVDLHMQYREMLGEEGVELEDRVQR